MIIVHCELGKEMDYLTTSPCDANSDNLSNDDSKDEDFDDDEVMLDQIKTLPRTMGQGPGIATNNFQQINGVGISTAKIEHCASPGSKQRDKPDSFCVVKTFIEVPFKHFECTYLGNSLKV
uniref:Uncharacterized protein n=1 Tax=Romanomermis culicivorax TaxID=13658 RepID=A0A915KBE4_ROMCU